MCVKSSGMAGGLANAQPLGSAKSANAPPPGLTRRSSPGWGGGWVDWAQVELTDALIKLCVRALSLTHSNANNKTNSALQAS